MTPSVHALVETAPGQDDRLQDVPRHRLPPAAGVVAPEGACGAPPGLALDASPKKLPPGAGA